MPAKGASKQIDRSCLVCAATTRIAHLGIDTCRACAVFYRRAKSGHDYVCRSSTGRCPTGKGINCKKCRFDHIERFINQPTAAHEQPSSYSAQPTTDERNSSRHSSESSPSAFTPVPARTELPIMERLKTHYRMMCKVRLQSELHARPNPPHPLEISLETGPFYPGTSTAVANGNRILTSALLDFAACVFPEFALLDSKEKWNIVVNNFYRFRLFEGVYRAGIVFPDDTSRMFGGYTVWMSVADMANFYSDQQQGDQVAVLEHVNQSCLRMQEIPAARELLKRVNLCHEEFLVVITMMFWSFGEMSVRDEVAQLGDRYREAILKELHVFYREELRLNDYATRLGELMMLLPVFERTHDMKEHFAMLYLLGIMPSDNFTYQLQK